MTPKEVEAFMSAVPNDAVTTDTERIAELEAALEALLDGRTV